MYFKYSLLFILFFVSFSLNARDVHIALIKDGPAQKEFLSEPQVIREIKDLLGNEFNPIFVADELTTGDWTIAGINRVLDNAYANKNVDVLVTLGAISSNEVGKRKSVAKPTIAAAIIDPAAQGLPYSSGKSLRNNFTYIADVKEPGHEIAFFKDFVSSNKLGVIIEPILFDSWPELAELLEEAERSFNVSFVRISAEGNPAAVVNKIPADVEAVIVGVLSQYSDQQTRQLAAELIKRKLPSYTFVGEKDVENGFLVTKNQMSQAQQQIARRVAIDIQRILLGANAKDLTVDMRFSERVIYNENTGLSIGFAPKWADIIDARIINSEKQVNRRAFTLREAIAFAIKNNLDLSASMINVDLSAKDVALARQGLYPSLSVGAGYTQIKETQVVPGVSPEKRADAQLSFSQVIYSEGLWANYDISKLLLESQESLYQSSLFDTVQQTATAYLNLLRTKSEEEIRQANLEVTRKNLELAENRLRVGSARKSDVLRWKSQLASDRKNLFTSQANRRNAELELSRILNLPGKILVDARQPEVGSLLNILTNSRFQKFVANEIHWQVFQDFYKQEALANSPELKVFESRLGINQREYHANRRGHYVPDVSLSAQAGHNFDQSGLGALDHRVEDSWTISLNATWSLDLNNKRRTTTSRKKLEHKQLELQKQALERQIVTSTGQALFQIGSSYPSIELTQISAQAASESLDLVRDAYAKGTVSISDLLDAQNNALSARLLAADAEYSFLQDYINLMRTAGDLKPLLDGQYSSQWFDRIIKYFRQQGIEVE
ncbi:TolC family protein [Pleionea sp. CnH1-48]|uniref:TolC family protein n=1 Tax=Pleionea sp. CnH1-48 TaxID=2954494 RepID=UPI002097219B|nr:TolC family protein [Pleionea sp. CnH1-48]MCO7223369.1 TolC family protein [Pleionea sp. CnH1-48]